MLRSFRQDTDRKGDVWLPEVVGTQFKTVPASNGQHSSSQGISSWKSQVSIALCVYNRLCYWIPVQWLINHWSDWKLIESAILRKQSVLVTYCTLWAPVTCTYLCVRVLFGLMSNIGVVNVAQLYGLGWVCSWLWSVRKTRLCLKQLLSSNILYYTTATTTTTTKGLNGFSLYK